MKKASVLGGAVILSAVTILMSGLAYGGNYTDHGDGTVTDNVTGLMWQKCSGGQTNDAACSGTATTYTWQGALDYCNALTLGGYSDWRLPSVKVLESIVDDSTSSPAIDIAIFPATGSNHYWSSTTSAYSTSYAWLVYFGAGHVVYFGKSLPSYARCVR